MRVLLRSVFVAMLLSVTMTSVGYADESWFSEAARAFKRDLGRVTNAITGESPARPGVTPPAPAGSPQAAGEPVANQVPAEVARAQDLLNRLGYPAGPVDGAYGDTTRAAIAQFQTRNGLEVTGDVTASLIVALQQAVAAETAATGAPASDLANASDEPRYESEWIGEIQSRLVSLGFPAGTDRRATRRQDGRGDRGIPAPGRPRPRRRAPRVGDACVARAHADRAGGGLVARRVFRAGDSRERAAQPDL
jgi:peptidoglycan hydrolase-like protein with peptidoglycan-binding domain